MALYLLLCRAMVAPARIDVGIEGVTLKTISRQFLWIAIVSSMLLMIIAVGYLKLGGVESESVEGKRTELKTLIQGYVADGILLKVDQDKMLPRVYVSPQFGILTASEKQVILEVVLDYFQLENEEIQSIDLFEAQAEHPIGHYNAHVLLMN